MERPTFYAVIPAFVRYADISANAKLMYGEITALCEKEGFCWASNGYFGKLYDANERTIRRWITELVKAGFVTVDLAANQYGERRIFLADARTKVAGQICPDRNARHNNTRIENDTRTDIPPTPKGEPDGFKEFWEAYPNKVKKPKAMAIWRRLKANHSDVMAGLRRWKASEQWTKDKGKYVPHPTSWLNAEGWNDAIAGEVVPLSPEDLAAATRRHEEAAQRSKAHLDNLARQRSNQLLGLSDDAA